MFLFFIDNRTTKKGGGWGRRWGNVSKEEAEKKIISDLRNAHSAAYLLDP